MGAELAAQLAEKLGIDQAKITAARTEIREANKPDPGAKPDPSDRPDPAAKRAELAKALAEKLGVDEAEVTTALTEIDDATTADRKEAFSTKLDEAVKAGTLTQAEADAVLKAAEAGVIPWAVVRGSGRPRLRHPTPSQDAPRPAPHTRRAGRLGVPSRPHAHEDVPRYAVVTQ